MLDIVTVAVKLKFSVQVWLKKPYFLPLEY